MSTSYAPTYAHLSPEPHLATRTLSRSARSATAQFYRYGDTNAIWADSELERHTGIIERMDLNTIELLPQPPKFHFVDRTGRKRSHTFDFLSVQADGSRRYLFCKYYNEYITKGYRDLVAAMRTSLDPEESVRIEVRTEYSYSRTELDSAELLREALRHPPNDVLSHVIERVAGADGGICLKEIASDLGGLATVFWVALRAVAEGILWFDPKTSFGPDTILTSRFGEVC